MKIYNKLHSFKTDEEMILFLDSLNKKSNFVRVAIAEKMERDNLLIKKDRRKKVSLSDLKESFAIFEENLTKKH
jgi:hypothetical protein